MPLLAHTETLAGQKQRPAADTGETEPAGHAGAAARTKCIEGQAPSASIKWCVLVYQIYIYVYHKCDSLGFNRYWKVRRISKGGSTSK